MKFKPSDIIKPVIGTALVSAVGLWGCASVFDGHNIEFPKITPPSSIPTPHTITSAIRASFTTSAAQVSPPVVASAPLQAAPSGEEITMEDYLATASDAEIEQVEEERGIKFSKLLEIQAAQDRNFSFSFNFKSAEPVPEVSRKPHNHLSETARWFDDIDLEESFRLTEEVTGEPASLQRKIAYVESKGNVKAVNKDTLACGPEQLMPVTLREMAKKYGEAMGLKDLADSVDKVIIGEDRHGRSIVAYRTKPGKGAYLAKQCHVPWVNSILASMNRIEKMNRIDNALFEKGYNSFAYVQSDIYISHFLGARPDIILARQNNPESPSVKFVTKIVVTQNRGMFYDADNNKRVVRQTFEHISQDGQGPSSVVRVQPYWRTPRAEYESRMASVLARFTPNTQITLSEADAEPKLIPGQTQQLLIK